MASITLFAAVTQATGQQLDDNLTLVSNQAPIPCSVSGTSSITLTPKANVYDAAAYTNNMQFSGVAVGTNPGAVQARLGSLTPLAVFKDSIGGPVQLSGGEIVAGNAFTLMYDPVLDGSNGGFHLFTGTQEVGSTINPGGLKLGTGSVLNRYLTATASMSFTVLLAQTAQEQNIALAGVLPSDAIQLGLPSLTANQALSYFGYVPASGTVAIRAVNASAASLVPASGIVRVTGMG